jgi:hypothetical protein
VYAYFNNDWEAFAVRDAERLTRILRAPEGLPDLGRVVHYALRRRLRLRPP